MSWIGDRIAEVDGKALVPIAVAAISLGSSCVGQFHQRKDAASSDQRYAIAFTIIGSHQATIDSLRANLASTRRELRRLRVIRGRGSRYVQLPDTVVYGRAGERRGTLLSSLRKLWPW